MKIIVFTISLLLLLGFVFEHKFSKSPTYPKVSYYSNGTIKSIGCFQDGSKIGSWTEYYENGNLKSVSHYSGLHDDNWTYSTGTSLEYYPNGRLKSRTQYYNPDFLDSNFNYVGLFPGVASFHDIELKNGDFYIGDTWDSTGFPLVISKRVIRENNRFKIPFELYTKGSYIADTLFYKLDTDGWLTPVE